MTLDDIRKFFSALTHASCDNTNPKAGHFKTLCQRYLAFLEAYLTVASQPYSAERKAELIAQLTELARLDSFNEFHSVITAIISDIQADGENLQAQLQLNNEDAQQFISGLETEFNITDLLDARHTPVINDKENIFAAFQMIEQDYNNSQWSKVLSPYQRLKTRLLSHNPDSFSEDEQADIIKFQDIYIKSLTKLASAENTFASAVDAFYIAMHEARKPSDDSTQTNSVLDECITQAMIRLGELIHTENLPMTNIEHFAEIIRITKQRVKTSLFSGLPEHLNNLQYKFAFLLSAFPTLSDESALKNYLLSIRMLNNLDNQNIIKPFKLVIFTIHTKLCERFTQFVMANINNQANQKNIIDYFNHINRCHQNLFEASQEWVAVQRFYLHTFMTCIALLAKKLSTTDMLAYLQTALLEHKKIPPQFQTPTDFLFESKCREEIMLASYQQKRQLGINQMFHLKNEINECLLYSNADLLDSSKVALLIFSYQEVITRTKADPNKHNTQRLHSLSVQMSNAHSANYSSLMQAITSFRHMRPNLSFYTQTSANSDQYHLIEKAINTFVPAATMTTLQQFKNFLDAFQQQNLSSPYASLVTQMSLLIVNMHRLHIVQHQPIQQLRITA